MRLANSLEDLFGTVHSYWSLATLVDSLTSDSKALSTELKLSFSQALTALQYVVVLGVCRLDDDNSSLRHSAEAIKKEDGTRYTALMAEIGKFRNSINQLKTQHRISYIAHTGKNIDFDALPVIPPLHDHVTAAVAIYEYFAGGNANLCLNLKSGWRLDLRDWLMNYTNPHEL